MPWLITCHTSQNAPSTRGITATDKPHSWSATHGNSCPTFTFLCRTFWCPTILCPTFSCPNCAITSFISYPNFLCPRSLCVAFFWPTFLCPTYSFHTFIWYNFLYTTFLCPTFVCPNFLSPIFLCPTPTFFCPTFLCPTFLCLPSHVILSYGVPFCVLHGLTINQSKLMDTGVLYLNIWNCYTLTTTKSIPLNNIFWNIANINQIFKKYLCGHCKFTTPKNALFTLF